MSSDSPTNAFEDAATALAKVSTIVSDSQTILDAVRQSTESSSTTLATCEQVAKDLESASKRLAAVGKAIGNQQEYFENQFGDQLHSVRQDFQQLSSTFTSLQSEFMTLVGTVNETSRTVTDLQTFLQSEIGKASRRFTIMLVAVGGCAVAAIAFLVFQASKLFPSG
jgi:DNA repair ATPase RecN